MLTPILFTLFPFADVWLVWRLTNNFYRRLYRKAALHGVDDIFERIVREENLVRPKELMEAYQEAIRCNPHC
ncbi:hypothetical protein MUA04_02955 [Enterobacteriaceae bacterium H11S18]|uniref:hypothetical protein n=1 Tax=Dryocola clanedunensis TaxID=2925396 RepID=UPI0022F0C6A9|nr:hypothetical protein [Dryocola clanedunensis]MCT4709158.1 hypothetical protein [Dryocola clanedunensis]